MKGSRLEKQSTLSVSLFIDSSLIFTLPSNVRSNEETMTVTAVNESISLIRCLAYFSTVSFLLFIFLKWINGVREKIALIDSLPGPTSFSTLLGNIPLEIVRHVGGNFEDAKDLYYSKYYCRLDCFSSSVDVILMRIRCGIPFSSHHVFVRRGTEEARRN